MTTPTQEPSVDEESQFHTYRTHRIPLFVHLIWIFFFGMAAYYILVFLFPSMQTEFVSVPAKRTHIVAPHK